MVDLFFVEVVETACNLVSPPELRKLRKGSVDMVWLSFLSYILFYTNPLFSFFSGEINRKKYLTIQLSG